MSSDFTAGAGSAGALAAAAEATGAATEAVIFSQKVGDGGRSGDDGDVIFSHSVGDGGRGGPTQAGDSGSAPASAPAATAREGVVGEAPPPPPPPVDTPSALSTASSAAAADPCPGAPPGDWSSPVKRLRR